MMLFNFMLCDLKSSQITFEWIRTSLFYLTWCGYFPKGVVAISPEALLYSWS